MNYVAAVVRTDELPSMQMSVASRASRAAIACMTAMVLCMVFAAMTLLMLRDGLKPRSDLGLKRQRLFLGDAACSAHSVGILGHVAAVGDA